MGNPILIIVTGPPGTGKTTLAEKIAERFRLLLVTKDGIKESLFDSLGIGDREWSRKLGFASYGVMFHVLESLLKAGISAIVEGNFRPQNETTRFLGLQNKHAFAALQIYCHCSEEVNVQRYIERTESGTRHPGHLDDTGLYRELEAELQKGTFTPLDIGGKVIDIDTTDFDKINYRSIYHRIRRHLERSAKE